MVTTTFRRFTLTEYHHGYSAKRIILPNQVVTVSCFPDVLVDLSKIFPGVSSPGD